MVYNMEMNDYPTVLRQKSQGNKAVINLVDAKLGSLGKLHSDLRRIRHLLYRGRECLHVWVGKVCGGVAK